MTRCNEIKHAITWGYFVDHCHQLKKGKCSFFHVTMIAAECLPGLSQLVSLLELLFSSNKKSVIYPTRITKTISNGKITQKVTTILVAASSSKKNDSSLRNSTTCISDTSTTHISKTPSLGSPIILGTKTPSSLLLKDPLAIEDALYFCRLHIPEGLIDAIRDNNTAEVKAILSRYPSSFINLRIAGYSLLELAAKKGHLELVQFLVESGAKDTLTQIGSSKFNNPRGTALSAAAANGQIEVAKYLLDNGAQDHLLFQSSVLSVAVMAEDLEMVKLLISYPSYTSVFSYSYAMNTAYDHDFADIYSFLLSQNIANLLPYKGDELLHHAALNDKSNFVKMLIEAGTNIDAQDEFGRTALHHAAKSKNQDLINWLLSHGANPLVTTTEEIGMGKYPNGTLASVKINTDYLEYAKLKEDYQAQIILSDVFFAGFNIKNTRFASLKECASALIDINVKFANGNTLLHYAFQKESKENLELAKYLLDKGIAIEKNDNGKTPYDYLSEQIANLKGSNVQKLQAIYTK